MNSNEKLQRSFYGKNSPLSGTHCESNCEAVILIVIITSSISSAVVILERTSIDPYYGLGRFMMDVSFPFHISIRIVLVAGWLRPHVRTWFLRWCVGEVVGPIFIVVGGSNDSFFCEGCYSSWIIKCACLNVGLLHSLGVVHDDVWSHWAGDEVWSRSDVVGLDLACCSAPSMPEPANFSVRWTLFSKVDTGRAKTPRTCWST